MLIWKLHWIFVYFIVWSLSVFVAPVAYSQYRDIDQNIHTHCSKKWTKRGQLNQLMYNYCAKLQRNGLAELYELRSKYRDLEWIKQAEKEIAKKWTKRGVTNYLMVHFGLNLAIESFLDISYGLKKGEYESSKITRCFNQWSRPYQQWQMIKFCLDN